MTDQFSKKRMNGILLSILGGTNKLDALIRLEDASSVNSFIWFSFIRFLQISTLRCKIDIVGIVLFVIAKHPDDFKILLI